MIVGLRCPFEVGTWFVKLAGSLALVLALISTHLHRIFNRERMIVALGSTGHRYFNGLSSCAQSWANVKRTWDGNVKRGDASRGC